MSSLKKGHLYIASIELLKGLGLILASFQHLRFFLPTKVERVETLMSGYFEQASPFLLFMRVLSHIIVTAFFLFIGANICFFSYRHIEKGSRYFLGHFFRRALLFVFLDILIALSLYYFISTKGRFIQPDSIFLVATTFSTFSFLFLVIPLLGSIPHLNRHLIEFGFLLVVGSTLLVPYALPLFGPNVATWLLLGGWTSLKISVAFPLLIWTGVACVGYGAAIKYLANPSIFFVNLRKIGYCSLALFVIARIQNGAFFNLLPGLPNQSIAEFFFLVKHPPSLTYLLFTGGFVFLFLSWVEKLPLEDFLNRFPGKILKVFSRNGTFFYAFHFTVAFAVSMLLFKEGTNSLSDRLIVWIMILILMYPACLLFEKVTAQIGKKN